MRRPIALFLLASCLCSPGCTLLHDATALLVYKARENVNDYFEHRRNREWAEDAWEEVSAQHAYSEDYACGFKDGFASYLYEGGNGEPPLVAPKRYRALKYQTASGYALLVRSRGP